MGRESYSGFVRQMTDDVHATVWKFQNFSIAQILCEINFGKNWQCGRLATAMCS